MESLGRLKLHYQPFHLSVTHTSQSFPKQSSLLIRPNSSFRYPSIKASSSSKSQNFIIPLKSPHLYASSTTNTSPMKRKRALEEHLAIHPTDVNSLRSLVEVKVTSYKLPEAVKLIDRLIKLEPDEPKWPVQKARYLTCEGDTESAKAVLEKVLAKDPLRAEAYHGLVVAYSDAGRDWRKVERRIEETMLRCERENKSKEYREFKHLVAQIRVLVEDEPGDFWPYFCQGAIYTLLKEEDKAEEQYLKFKKLVPENYNYMEDFLVNNLFAGELLKNRGSSESCMVD
ncbi:hypothetical protein Bca52824_096767 [Brassica carinata]|uniref:Chloroplast lumen common family protein n=1 Tax=Brassica carinata TaxID=52824 RepID=A0A8X7TI97_BRACI|nr:hypothetical protein Bca52824_096767 [Brassica carinata]